MKAFAAAELAAQLVSTACQWVPFFVDWFDHQKRHSGIKLVISQRWIKSIRCWKQPDLVWINEPLATQQTSLQVTLAKEAYKTLPKGDIFPVSYRYSLATSSEIQESKLWASWSRSGMF